MTAVSIDDIRHRLEGVIDPCSVAAGNEMNILEMGLVDRIELTDGHLDVGMRLTSPQCPMLQHFVAEVSRVLDGIPGITDVTVRGDSGMNWTPDDMTPEARQRRRSHLGRLAARP